MGICQGICANQGEIEFYDDSRAILKPQKKLQDREHQIQSNSLSTIDDLGGIYKRHVEYVDPPKEIPIRGYREHRQTKQKILFDKEIQSNKQQNNNTRKGSIKRNNGSECSHPLPTRNKSIMYWPDDLEKHKLSPIK